MNSTPDTRARRYKSVWEEEFGEEGIGPCPENILHFNCALCARDGGFKIGNKAVRAVTLHIDTLEHKISKGRVCNELREVMRSLLNAHAAAGGLTTEELMNLTVAEMPPTAPNNKLREMALKGLICTSDSPLLPPAQEKIVWQEREPVKPAEISVERSVRQNTRDYLQMLRRLERDAKAHFGYTDEEGWQQQWTFQQDGAPSHKSNETQRWLLGHFPDIIIKDQWPAASPDLNPIELIWGILKPRVNPEAHQTVGSLKETLLREWEALTPDEINACIDGREEEVGEKKSGGGWMGRLRAMLAHKGGRFE